MWDGVIEPIRKKRDIGRGDSKRKGLGVRDCLVPYKQAKRDKRFRNKGNKRETVQLHYGRWALVLIRVNKGK